jgi:hypothetical protein
MTKLIGGKTGGERPLERRRCRWKVLLRLIFKKAGMNGLTGFTWLVRSSASVSFRRIEVQQIVVFLQHPWGVGAMVVQNRTISADESVPYGSDMKSNQ